MQIETSRHTIFVEGDLAPFRLTTEIENVEPNLELIHLTLSSATPAFLPPLALRWTKPSVGIHAHWTPTTNTNRTVEVDWSGGHDSKATFGAPVLCLHDLDGTNRQTFAVSDTLNRVDYKAGLREESGEFVCHVGLFAEKLPPTTTYQTTLRIDAREVPYYVALREVAAWWERDIEYSNGANSSSASALAPVPDVARQPMYSTWYSFHQNLEPAAIEEQCRIAKTLGCEAVIVDDGWQTADNARAYAFCGDWQPAPEKIADMKSHVARVHALGMKYLLWYSVPFVGPETRAWGVFKDKLLRFNAGEHGKTGIVDPRFPDVREYLIETYETALRDWDLDGFKLDFVDDFWPDETSRAAFGNGRDFDSVPLAVDRLLTDVLSRLRAIKPEIMIEFRQNYVGPQMRKYGNLFRAGDCPNDALANRTRTIDIRLLCGATACHSDMIMWHPGDSVESAALQLANVLFSVPQISMLLDKLSALHREMTTFYLDFWRQHRDVLLDGELQPHHPEAFYPLIVARNSEKWLAAIYDQSVICLPEELPSQTILVNGTLNARVVVESSTRLSKNLVVRDCRGHVVRKEALDLPAGLHSVAVPAAGVIDLT